MSQKRINVGLLETAHTQANTASAILKQDLQDFATTVVERSADQIIRDFQSGKSAVEIQEKFKCHSHRDNRPVKKSK